MGKKKKTYKHVEVVFKEDIQWVQAWDVLEESLCKMADIPNRSMGEFGSGYSAVGVFPAEDADEIADRFKTKIGKKVIPGVTIKSVKVSGEWQVK